MNPLYEQLKMFEEDVRLCALRKSTAAGISGPTGIGKTFIVNKVAREVGIKAPDVIKATPEGFIQALWLHRNNAMVFFDDFDKLFSSLPLVNTVKDLVEPVYDADGRILNRRITNQTKYAYDNQMKKKIGRGNPNIPDPEFFCRPCLIAATNVDIENGLSDKMQPHLDAVQSKGLKFIVCDRKRDNIHDYIVDTIKADPGPFMGSLGKTDFAEVLKFFSENRYKFPFFNFRPIHEMVRHFHDPDVRDWQAKQKMNFLKTERDNV